MVWNKAGSTTLGSAGDDLDITSMTANKFSQYMIHKIASGNAQIDLKFNNSSSSDYARRSSYNGASDATGTSQTALNIHNNKTTDDFFVLCLADISGEEKLGIMFNVNGYTAGAGTAPERQEFVIKSSSTTNITRVDLNNSDTGNYDTDSNLTVLGSDGTESLNVQDGAIYYDTDLNKEYVLYNNTWTEL